MYTVLLSDKANKQIKKLPKNITGIILRKVYSIRDNPLRYLKKLEGTKLWRLRVMDYRVIIDILISGRKIFVVTVDKRERVY